MSESKKNRLMNFLKFLVIKVKPSCANTKRSQSKDEMINDNEIEIEIEIDQSQHLSTLPDHLIVEHILPRLPVKAVFRYKSVCKYWNSVISNPEFAKLHLTCSFSRPQFLLFEDYHSSDKLHMYFLHYADNKGLVSSLPFVDDGVYKAFELVGSCNGLICLHVMALNGSFVVWNPAIRLNRYIIDPYYQELITGYGFGYASSTHDYKIVASYSSILDREMGRFYVYSSKAGVWIRIQSLDGSHYAGELTRFQGVLIGDTLYWPTRTFKSKGVVGFSLVDYQLQQVPGTEWLIEYDKTDIFEIKGRLSLWCYRCDEGSEDVWTLRRHCSVNSWETLFSIDTKGISVLRFTKTGKYLVQHYRKIRLLDPRNEEVVDEEVCQEGVDFHGQIMETCDYVDTLTPPFGLPGYDGGLGEPSGGSDFSDDYSDELQSFSLYA